MSPDDPGLSRLRVEVFAVLLPYNEPISAYKFRKEFEDAMGSECDFKKFGFASMDRFLQAHPKVQAVSGADGQMLYKAKMDESTAQLQKFVQKQKKKKKGKGGKKSGRGRGGYAWQWQTSRQINIQTIPSARDSRYTTSYRQQQQQQQHNRSTTLSATSQSFRRGSYLHPPQPASFAITRRPFFARLNPTSPSPSAGPSYGVPAAQFSASRLRSSSHFSIPSADRRPVAQPQAQQPVAATPVQFDLNMSRYRILQTMLHCSGSATIARFLSAYKQLYSRPFDGDECIRLFGTRKLRRIIHDHFSDEILVTKMDDEILLVSKKVVNQATEWAVANSRNGHTVYEPSKVHCKLPNLQVACDNIVQMLIDSFPRHIPISELSQAYENAYGVLLDPTAVFGKSWTLLVSGLFKAKLALSLDKESVGLQEKLVQELQLEKKLRNKQKQMTETSKSLSANGRVELDLSEEDEDEEESDDEEEQSEDDKDEEERRGKMKGNADANALDELRKLTLRKESNNKFDESSPFSTDQESRLSPIRPPFPTSPLHSSPSHPRQSAVPFPPTFPAAILTSKFNSTPSTQSIMLSSPTDRMRAAFAGSSKFGIGTLNAEAVNEDTKTQQDKQKEQPERAMGMNTIRALLSRTRQSPSPSQSSARCDPSSITGIPSITARLFSTSHPSSVAQSLPRATATVTGIPNMSNSFTAFRSKTRLEMSSLSSSASSINPVDAPIPSDDEEW